MAKANKKKPSKEEKALSLREQEAPIVVGGADSLISQAIQLGSNVDTMERLMAMRKEMLAEQAKQAFNEAMAMFQAECPVIEKTKGVRTKSGKTAYKYAPIESIVEQVKTLLQKHGFKYMVTMELIKGENNSIQTVKVICTVMHKLGHSENSSFEVPLGTKTDVMSQTQVVAAASTFAKRYAFLNAFGIMTGDEDNDTADQRGDQEQEDQQQQVTRPAQKAATPPPNPTVAQSPAASKTVTPPAPQKPAGPKQPSYNPMNDYAFKTTTPEQRANFKVTNAQVGFLMKLWTEYMTKSGVTDKDVIEEQLHKIIPWAFRQWESPTFKVPQGRSDLTKAQASYLIDFIPTLPIKEKAPGKVEEEKKIEELKKEAVTAKIIDVPVVPSKPALPTAEDMDTYREAMVEASTSEELETVWAVVRDLKAKEELPKGTFPMLHRAYMKRKGEINPPIPTTK